MTSITDGSVRIQTSSESAASPPSWFGEVVLMAAHLRRHDVLTKISERVRFARRRFGRYEVIDFLAVLFGYAISGEPTLEAFRDPHPYQSRPKHLLDVIIITTPWRGRDSCTHWRCKGGQGLNERLRANVMRFVYEN